MTSVGIANLMPLSRSSTQGKTDLIDLVDLFLDNNNLTTVNKAAKHRFAFNRNNIARLALALDLIVFCAIGYYSIEIGEQWPLHSGDSDRRPNVRHPGYFGKHHYVSLTIYFLYHLYSNFLLSAYLLDNGDWLEKANALYASIPGLGITDQLLKRLGRLKHLLMLVFFRDFIFMAIILITGQLRYGGRLENSDAVLVGCWFVYSSLSMGLSSFYLAGVFGKYYLMTQACIGFSEQLKREILSSNRLTYETCIRLLNKYSNFCIFMHHVNRHQKKGYVGGTLFVMTILLPMYYSIFYLYLAFLTKAIYAVWCLTYVLVILLITKLTDRILSNVEDANEILYFKICISRRNQIIRESIRNNTNIELIKHFGNIGEETVGFNILGNQVNVRTLITLFTIFLTVVAIVVKK